LKLGPIEDIFGGFRQQFNLQTPLLRW